jgi:hypothetical protein
MGNLSSAPGAAFTDMREAALSARNRSLSILFIRPVHWRVVFMVMLNKSTLDKNLKKIGDEMVIERA